MTRVEDVRVLTPRHLGELFALYSDNPEARLFAGGTLLMTTALSTPILDLSFVPELNRIKRSERYVEIGPSMSFARIISISRHAIPRILAESLGASHNQALKNLATVGGNICRAAPDSDILPALYALEARLELRSSTSTRWLPIGQFIRGPANTALRENEILTRIRIPLEDWNVQIYRKVTAGNRSPMLTFCGLARILKGMVQDFRFSVGSVNPTILRDRALEAQLIGRKLPLAERDRKNLASDLEERLEPINGVGSRYSMETVLRMVSWFLDELNQIHIYG